MNSLVYCKSFPGNIARQDAFTIIEMLIVVVILGVMSMIAIPRMTGQQEVGRVGEAVQTLQALHASQLQYCLDHSCATYPAVCTAYDVDIPALSNFGAPACANNGNISLTRTGGAYTVTVDKDGAYTCPACPANVARILP